MGTAKDRLFYYEYNCVDAYEIYNGVGIAMLLLVEK